MHKTAYRLRVQIHNGWPVGLAVFSDAAYAGDLTRGNYVHGPSRMAKIDHELHADHQALTHFGAAARRVAAADRRLAYALIDERANLSARDKRHARNRMERNLEFIIGTFADLEKRIAAFDYAIDRTRIGTPEGSAAAVEGSLSHLRERAASLHYELTQVYRLGYGALGAPGEKPRPHEEPGRRRTIPDRPPNAPIDIRPPREHFK